MTQFDRPHTAKKKNLSMASTTFDLTAGLRTSNWVKFLSTRPRCGPQLTSWLQTTETEDHRDAARRAEGRHLRRGRADA